MTRKSKPIELLAPAGNREIGTAAINSGADAVYIGAPRFGAREAAGNSLRDIEALAAYAHIYYAKVYVALNTLLYDHEINAARQLVHQLYEAGIDGLIIQDPGLLELDLPPLPLFASTQMHNTTAEKVLFLEKAGFQRVILARELALEQIRAIRRTTTIDLECFVHGALCVGYSGQCALSYALGGRSGNRGQCAQPCRRRYRLDDNSGKELVGSRYLLSLKDLNLSKYLAQLIDAGISSFKIEGRLKDRAYVVNTVAFYRQKLDRILAKTNTPKSSSGSCRYTFTPDPDKTFTRGFTDYFIQERNSGTTSWETPKSRGERIGTVTQTKQNSFFLKTNKQLRSGDGICFLDRQERLQGSLINKVQGSQIWPAKIEHISAGTHIFRNQDHHFLKQLEKASALRRIELEITLTDTPQGFCARALDQDGNSAEAVVQTPHQPADKPEPARRTIEKQLRKLGDSNFICTELIINLNSDLFIPVSTLNQLRRDVIAALVTVREHNRPRAETAHPKNDFPYPRQEHPACDNVLNKLAEQFFRRHGATDITPAVESASDLHGKKVMTSKYCIRFHLGLCSRDALGADIREPLSLVDEKDRRFPLRFNCRDCSMELFYDYIGEEE
ncbi:MAG: U32 family peptidase [Deltaproteobacteria bacterium]|nr:U32 family peptidase [Deltaproteobacteria bacterium]